MSKILKDLLLFFSSLKRRLLFIVSVLRFRLKGRLFICWNDWNSWKSIFYKSNSSSFDPKKGLLIKYCERKAPFVWNLSHEFERTSFRNKRRLLIGATSNYVSKHSSKSILLKAPLPLFPYNILWIIIIWCQKYRFLMIVRDRPKITWPRFTHKSKFEAFN